MKLCEHGEKEISAKAIFALRFFDNKSIIRLNEKMKEDSSYVVQEHAISAWDNRKKRLFVAKFKRTSSDYHTLPVRLFLWLKASWQGMIHQFS